MPRTPAGSYNNRERWFDKSNNSLVQSNNILIITDGVILAATIGLIGTLMSSEVPFDYKNTLTGSNFFINLILFLIVLPISISIAFSLGSINSGLLAWSQEPTKRKDLTEREKKAFYWYSWATRSLGFGLIGIFGILLVVALGGCAFVGYGVLFVIFTLMIIIRRLYGDFGE